MDDKESSDQKPVLVNKNAEIGIRGYIDNIVLKNEETVLSINDETLKQEPLEQDSKDTSCNVFDSVFEEVKHELCDYSSIEQQCDKNDDKQQQVSGSLLTSSLHLSVNPESATLATNSVITNRDATDQAETSNNDMSEHNTFSKGFHCQKTSQNEYSITEPNIKHSILTVDKLHDSKATLVTCKICKYQCKYNSGMIRHMKSHRERLTCTFCQYKCDYKRDLLRHMRTHTGKKSFACELCQYRSDVKSKLTVHMRTHTGEKPFACEFCQYRSTQKSRLEVHMRTHTGEKPFACEFCQYRGNEKSSLVLHMRTHSGEKPFSCNLCTYKCIVNSQLLVHMRTHSGEKPFACKFCPYKCAQSGNLMKHERKAHSK